MQRSWQRACFGSTMSQVRILSFRPKRTFVAQRSNVCFVFEWRISVFDVCYANRILFRLRRMSHSDHKITQTLIKSRGYFVYCSFCQTDRILQIISGVYLIFKQVIHYAFFFYKKFIPISQGAKNATVYLLRKLSFLSKKRK